MFLYVVLVKFGFEEEVILAWTTRGEQLLRFFIVCHPTMIRMRLDLGHSQPFPKSRKNQRNRYLKNCFFLVL